MTRLSVAAVTPPVVRNSATTASRFVEPSVANGWPARRARWSSAERTAAPSRPRVATISAMIAASSAPGTSYSALAGIIMPAIMRRSSRCAAVSSSFDCMMASIKEVGEALLHLIGDVERDGLDGGGRIDAARGDEQAAVDDEEVLHVVRTAPFIDHRALRVGAHARGAEQVPAAIEDRHIHA